MWRLTEAKKKEEALAKDEQDLKECKGHSLAIRNCKPYTYKQPENESFDGQSQKKFGAEGSLGSDSERSEGEEPTQRRKRQKRSPVHRGPVFAQDSISLDTFVKSVPEEFGMPDATNPGQSELFDVLRGICDPDCGDLAKRDFVRRNLERLDNLSLNRLSEAWKMMGTKHFETATRFISLCMEVLRLQ